MLDSESVLLKQRIALFELKDLSTCPKQKRSFGAKIAINTKKLKTVREYERGRRIEKTQREIHKSHGSK